MTSKLHFAPKLAFQLFRHKEIGPAQQTVGLLYHIVDDCIVPHAWSLYHYKNLSQFELDLLFLQKHFNIIGLSDLGAPSTYGKPHAYLTFDDGMSQCFDNIRPILLKRGIPAAFFISSGFIDNKAMFFRHKISLCIAGIESSAAEAPELHLFAKRYRKCSSDKRDIIRWLRSLQFNDNHTIDDACKICSIDWQDYLRTRQPYMSAANLRRMSAEGFEIGAHSVNHPHMGTVDVDTFLQETNESLAFVNQITGKDRSPFAFPFTSDGVSAQSIEYVLRHAKGLGPVFDTQGAPQDGFGFHSRTPADSPDGSASVSNLSTILQL
jgi:peptidoglycan/xylan/chitin deacetylase (PgdA/CDA1 family)